MAASIFSTYKTGENRVTASVLAVLSSLSLARTERLIGALLEDARFELVRFQNQPAQGAKGVPDAEISSSFTILIETKIAPKSAGKSQLKRHLKRLDKSQASTQWLLMLTPDASRPPVIDELDDERLVWTSFAALDQAINDLLDDQNEVVSEREAFLLRELQKMLNAEGLIGSAKDVVVVPALRAWPHYKKLHAYICQPERPFRKVKWIAFYTKGEIKPLVPEILDTLELVVWENDRYDGPLGDLARRMLEDQPEKESTTNKVFLLTSPDDPRTHRLPLPVVNDLTSASGTTIAFTQSQRYVELDKLLTAKHTSEIAKS